MKLSAQSFVRSDSSRMIQLDVLRGVAILLVLFVHERVPAAEAGLLEPVVKYLLFLGPSGVDLFFVLSGFLVGGLLLKELRGTGRLDVRRFLIRRAFRIWPSYFIFVAAVFVLMLHYEHTSVVVIARTWLPNLLHLQNYLGSPRVHTWSLAVEEHFYLALPFILFLLTRSKSKLASIRAVPIISVSVFVLCALLRLYATIYPPVYDPPFATHLRMDSLFFGVLLAYFYYFEPRKLGFAVRHRVKLLCLGAALLLFYPALVIEDQGNLVVNSIGNIILYLGYGCFLLAMVHTSLDSGWLGRRLSGFSARIIAFIGYFSYPIYLWHIDIGRGFGRLLEMKSMANGMPELRWLTSFFSYVLLAVAGGVFFGILLEKPSLAVRDRLFPARVRPDRAPKSGVAVQC